MDGGKAWERAYHQIASLYTTEFLPHVWTMGSVMLYDPTMEKYTCNSSWYLHAYTRANMVQIICTCHEWGQRWIDQIVSVVLHNKNTNTFIGVHEVQLRVSPLSKYPYEISKSVGLATHNSNHVITKEPLQCACGFSENVLKHISTTMREISRSSGCLWACIGSLGKTIKSYPVRFLGMKGGSCDSGGGLPC